MGNITSLNRDGTGAKSYSYMNEGTSNQLKSVAGLTVTDYVYDGNGNATTDGRNDKMIGYNYLNLPETVSGGLSYRYDATGRKLSKNSSGSIRSYVNGIEYNGTTIDLIHTGEGIARNNSGTYSYEYNLSDHLGNVRATIYRNPVTESMEVLQRDDYYVFGKRAVVNGGTNKYLYNGKELQDELGQYDYGARIYDAEIGRWNVIDRFAEKYYGLTTYHYGANNPIRNIDVNGDSIRVFSSKGTNASGAFVGTENITSKMFLKGFEKSMKSRDFRAYISQYAMKGLKIGRYYFSKDGEFADAKLTITEYNLNAADQGTIDALNGGHLEGYHTIGLNAEGTGVEANMHIYTRNHSTAGEIAETMGHESQLHGYKDKYLIRGFNKSGISGFNNEKKKYDSGERGKKDHDALNRNDQQHGGVRRYKRFEEEREQ